MFITSLIQRVYLLTLAKTIGLLYSQVLIGSRDNTPTSMTWFLSFAVRGLPLSACKKTFVIILLSNILKMNHFRKQISNTHTMQDPPAAVQRVLSVIHLEDCCVHCPFEITVNGALCSIYALLFAADQPLSSTTRSTNVVCAGASFIV